jgi:RHS repeat-associated protein
MKKVEGSTTLYYVRSSIIGQAVMEISGSAVYRAYVYNGGSMVAMQGSDGQFYWRHSNHLGSGSKLTNTSGTVVYRAEHDPHGNVLLETGSPTLTVHKFTSYERDSSGLDYANARMFSGSRGRFTKPDPAGLKAGNLKIPQTLNQYTYTNNDPVNYVDPTGLIGILDNPSRDWLCRLGLLIFCPLDFPTPVPPSRPPTKQEREWDLSRCSLSVFFSVNEPGNPSGLTDEQLISMRAAFRRFFAELNITLFLNIPGFLDTPRFNVKVLGTGKGAAAPDYAIGYSPGGAHLIFVSRNADPLNPIAADEAFFEAYQQRDPGQRFIYYTNEKAPENLGLRLAGIAIHEILSHGSGIGVDDTPLGSGITSRYDSRISYIDPTILKLQEPYKTEVRENLRCND